MLSVLRRIGFRGHATAEGVLLFKTDRIGDFVLATGVLHLLCERLGMEQLTLMVSPVVLPLAQREFPGLQIVSVPQATDNFRGRMWSRWWKARRIHGARRYRQMVCLRHHPTLFEDLLLTSIPAEESVGITRTKLGEVFWVRRLRTFRAHQNVAYPTPDKAPSECLEIEAHRRLAEKVLGQSVDISEVIPRLDRFKAASGDYLLLLPYGSDPVRTYPEARLVQALADAKLPESAPLVVCGEAAQRPALSALAAALESKLPNPVQLLFPSSVSEFADAVAAAHCVFAMESAGAHIATTLDRRGVFILGGGHFGYFGPWRRSPRRHWLHLRLDCFGCDWACNQPYVRCIYDIPAQAVATALREAWIAQ